MKKEENRIVNLVYEDISDRYQDEMKRINYYMQIIRSIEPKALLGNERVLPYLVMSDDLELFVEEMRNIAENVLDMYGLLGDAECFYKMLDLPDVKSTDLIIEMNRDVMSYADLDCFDVYVLDSIEDEVSNYEADERR